ncbi:MAG: DUF805 domain-containing protein [Muribaculaceae bacterium]|nr:DUF805 domain-containing protein [Muribaculaceae bacterium]
MYQRQVDFVEAIKRALTINYCNFNGRASRSEYWWFCLFQFIVVVALNIIFGTDTPGTIVKAIVSLAFFLPGLGLAVRRLHDIDKSGWWIFLSLIPVVGTIILIVWYIKPSMPYPNEYGPVPFLNEGFEE